MLVYFQLPWRRCLSPSRSVGFQVWLPCVPLSQQVCTRHCRHQQPIWRCGAQPACRHWTVVQKLPTLESACVWNVMHHAPCEHHPAFMSGHDEASRFWLWYEHEYEHTYMLNLSAQNLVQDASRARPGGSPRFTMPAQCCSACQQNPRFALCMDAQRRLKCALRRQSAPRTH